jgi:serine/threonine protein kinase
MTTFISANTHGKRDILIEGLRMSNLAHERILPLIGIAFDEQYNPLIITPYMQNGALQAHLRNENNVRFERLTFINVRQTFSLQQLLKFVVEIAEGMQYLHAQKFIHRDLATRNCL